ncbi:hypothetical protein TWF106_007156 [Orbilia oligospora]|uniref:Fe2OG dioxygenase domain-containing protein n=1 Tax=Orbilia oligospora TaxID=2813651 RepID=A0A7C8QNR5_ORBOL|nr:hypothetical protein TWF106_007156 [Orbilia oligospora]
MAWLTAHLKTLFASKRPKNPPKRKPPTREEKGKYRATDVDDDNNNNFTSNPLSSNNTQPTSSTSSLSPSLSSTTNSSEITDSDLLPIIHHEELHLIPQILTQFPAFYLIGHNLPPAPLPQAKHLLTSPESTKQSLIHPKKSTVRGYNHAKPSGREWWDYTPDHGGTLLTLEDENFRYKTKEYFEKSIELLQRICNEFNQTLNENGEKRVVIPEAVMDDIGFSTMRYLRYSPTILERQNINNNSNIIPQSNNDSEPPIASSSSSSHSNGSSSSTKNNNRKSQQQQQQPQKEDGYSLPRMEAHTDHGILTLMTSTEPSGLYVWDRNGKIFSAPPISGTVMIIAGDLMTHFTALEGKSIINDGKGAIGEGTVLPSVHAVVLPKGGVERYSVAVFLRPKREMVVSKYRVKKEDGEIVEENMTFGKWAEEKGQVRGRRCWMVGQERLSGGQDV